jgi:hypothetical protein
VQLALPGGLETVQIKPGQQIDLSSGGIFEPYEYQAVGESEVFDEAAGATEAAPDAGGSAAE